jgi:hypothetical protein
VIDRFEGTVSDPSALLAALKGVVLNDSAVTQYQSFLAARASDEDLERPAEADRGHREQQSRSAVADRVGKGSVERRTDVLSQAAREFKRPVPPQLVRPLSLLDLACK